MSKDSSVGSPAPNTLDAASAEKLHLIQATGILKHTATASVISTTFALILTLYLLPVFGAAAQVWFGLKVLSALPRFVLGQAFRFGWWKPRTAHLSWFLWTSLVLDGVVWGLPGVWGSGQHGEIVALLVACLASVAMLATFGLQVQFKATLAFVVPILIPPVIALVFRGDAFGLFAAAGTALVLVQTLVTSLASERRITREFVAHERLADALAQVKRQSSVKTLFLGTMSHELRTPLHGILGLTELIQREVSDTKISHQLQLIRSSGSHLLELIGALLDVSRIDSGKLTLYPAPFDLSADLRNLAELYSMRADAKGVSFEATLDIGESCWVQGDATRWRQILHNLLGNAIKFTKRGVVSLSAKEGSGTYTFVVTDTGPGIDPKDLPHIFEAFRQADETASRPAEGAGLGLTIARELAIAMGGELSVESSLGIGTRFQFALQLRRLESSEIPSAGKSADGPPRLRDRFQVLLVEDNDVNALIAQAHLDRLGVGTTRVVDGKKGVEAACGATRPHLILMDCRMPVMDGPTAAREIRRIERSANLARVPIIALTAAPSEEDRAECFEAGMDGFLMKPFTDAQLLQAIRSYIYDARDERMRDHPLYEFAAALEDTDPDIFGSTRQTMH